MKQQKFESLHKNKWQTFEHLLNGNAIKQQVTSQNTGYDFVNLYRLVCQHYALSKQRNYSPQLVNYLNALVLEGHQLIYKKQSHFLNKVYVFFADTFPNRLRYHYKLFWLSFFIFTATAILMGLVCYHYPNMIFSIMPDAQVREMESMYNPANGMAFERDSRTDMMMFGHYIYNNISIDFRIYAMGIFAGIGTIAMVFFNGLIIGGVAGHLTQLGYNETFWPFVAGHGSFELTAAVISGAAGLRLSQSLFMPGNYSRLDAFKIAGKESIELLLGAATMTFIAAFIEAFWSSSVYIPVFVKLIVAAILWAIVIYYLAFFGKKNVSVNYGVNK